MKSPKIQSPKLFSIHYIDIDIIVLFSTSLFFFFIQNQTQGLSHADHLFYH
jgi:hypothetical protein